MKLNYKASNIAKAEREHNMNFFDMLTTLGNTPSMSGLLFLFEAGNATEDDFDAVFKEGIDKVLVVIMEGLSDAGFLGQEDVRVMKKALEEQMKSQRTSLSSGETAKK